MSLGISETPQTSLSLREMQVQDDTKNLKLEINVHLNLEPTEENFHIDNKYNFEYDKKNNFEIKGNILIANAYTSYAFAMKVFLFFLKIFLLSRSNISLLSM